MAQQSDLHLAQANIAHMKASYEDPVMAGFVARLDPLNSIADNSHGFIWRLQDETADAAAARIFSADQIIFNMSVWESIESLETYVYKTGHVEAVQKRSEWFEKPDRAPFVLWWIEPGHRPTIEEAKARFDLLWTTGPSADAFTFRHAFPAHTDGE